MSTQGSEAGKDFDFSDRDFQRVRALIHAQAGIALNDSKRNMVYSRLSRRLREKSLGSFEEYLGLVERGDPAEREQFVNSLTTNLTSFYREPHHFPILAELVRRAVADHGEARIWCAAASTGEEPWSIAMTAADALGAGPGRIKLVASDIDTEVLSKARAGIYPRAAVERVPVAQLKRHFLEGTGSNEGSVRVRDTLRGLVEFKRINLLEAAWALQGPFDAIFCRNVMIYFDKPTQSSLIARMAPMLQPWGLYFAGHSENLGFARHLLAPKGHTVYCRADAASGSGRAS